MLNRDSSVSLILQKHLMVGWGLFFFLIQAAVIAAECTITGVYINCQMIMSSKCLQMRETHKSMGESSRRKYVCFSFLFTYLWNDWSRIISLTQKQWHSASQFFILSNFLLGVFGFACVFMDPVYQQVVICFCCSICTVSLIWTLTIRLLFIN